MSVPTRTWTLRPMPMIDVYAAAGTFDRTHELARDLSRAVMRCLRDAWGGALDHARDTSMNDVTVARTTSAGPTKLPDL